VAKKQRRLNRPRKNAKVQKVFDSDTFRIDRKIRGTDRIRLNKINTPEKGRPGSGRATNITKRMIEGKMVTIDPVTEDKYGRLIANVYKNGNGVRLRLNEKTRILIALPLKELYRGVK